VGKRSPYGEVRAGSYLVSLVVHDVVGKVVRGHRKKCSGADVQRHERNLTPLAHPSPQLTVKV
jgi:hypothetical protein